MEEYKIEKNIPIKPSIYGKGNVELLKKMEIGDSILFEEDSMRIRNRFYTPSKRLGVKVLVRKTDEGSRMWRVE